MATPTVSASFNKSAYAPGELMTLTVDHADADRLTFSAVVTVTDSTGASGTATVSAVVDSGTVTVVSTPARPWAVVSQTAGRTVLTATA